MLVKRQSAMTVAMPLLAYTGYIKKMRVSVMAAALTQRHDSDFFIYIQQVDLKKVAESTYSRRSVGCIILTQQGELLLQQRDDNCLRFPGCLATFGGGIEPGESPGQAVMRELKEELGATVNESSLVSLGAITTAETGHGELLHAYFWHDKHGTISGCYEGEARYYADYMNALRHPKIMADVCWLVHECQSLQLLK
jgi:8-oxo-dGTP diphosphatase